MKKEDLICIAAIAGAFGVKGEVKLKAFTELPENCVSYGPLLSGTGEVLLTPESFRLVKGGVAIRCTEVQTREEAESLKSTKLYVPRQAFPEPEEDEFYAADLIGLDVKSTDGKRVGTILNVVDFGAGELLEIKPVKVKGKSGASFYHPFTKVGTPKVDLQAKRVVIKIIEVE
ncbi:ribosome maturation factor RimM [Hellea balneolensis]|uniref:ribosome maturation factor RimM n=1 Tax=Hellea balneolensis TaxID=287478 RepID=UPI000428E055|nr:ribosome maturation factor RimM [Hellea balneolensis]